VKNPVPEQESCSPKGRKGSKGKSRKEKTSVSTTDVNAVTKVNAEKLMKNPDSMRTIEDMAAPDAYSIVTKVRQHSRQELQILWYLLVEFRC
jgi:hypothetical protein